ncbi:MAG: hypothetical protein ACI3XQ_11020 [Eubacteriales bacterium]
MKEYKNPAIYFIAYTAKDVITLSNNGAGDGDGEAFDHAFPQNP